jgi:hypothetical protein
MFTADGRCEVELKHFECEIQALTASTPYPLTVVISPTLPGPACLISKQAPIFIYNPQATTVKCSEMVQYGCVCVTTPSPPPPLPPPPSPPPSCAVYTEHPALTIAADPIAAALYENTNGVFFNRQMIGAHTGTWNDPDADKCCSICSSGYYNGVSYTFHTDPASGTTATFSHRSKPSRSTRPKTVAPL